MSFAEIDQILRKLSRNTSVYFSLYLEDDESSSEKNWILDVSPKALFEESSIFYNCSEQEVRSLLSFFISGGSLNNYALDCQLSLLLKERGALFQEEMETIIRTTDWSMFSSPSLLLSFLPHMPDYESWVIRLADVVPEDFRDGFFIGCMGETTRMIDLKLRYCFEKWFCESSTYPSGTGEMTWIEFFLKKWLQIYPFQSLEKLIRFYFERS